MQDFAETIEIQAPPERVWRALSQPAEVVCWDTGIVAPIDAPPDYPRPGQYVRWRYRLGGLRLTLHDRPTRVDAPTVLRSSIRLGPFDFDETYTLMSKSMGTTQLEARLSLTSRVALVGPVLECVVGRPLARATVRTSLAAIKRHCEQPDRPSATEAPAEPSAERRPGWATVLAVFCATTVVFLVVRDVWLPEVRDTEVWFGVELHGGWARASAPLHWLIFAVAAWGYWRFRPWVWPWASVYLAYVAVSHLMWNATSASGDGWAAGVWQLALFSVPAVVLLWARPARAVASVAAPG